MIGKPSRILVVVGIVCVGSALIWQNHSWVVYELTHLSSSMMNRSSGSGQAWELVRNFVGCAAIIRQ